MSFPVIQTTAKELPFALAIPGGLSYSDVLEIEVNLEDDSCLETTFRASDDDIIDSRIPLSLSMTVDRAICKSGKNQKWDIVELTKKFTIPEKFLLSIVTLETEYRIEVNGHLYCTFSHQFPPTASQLLDISAEKGNARVRSVNLMKQIKWLSTKIGQELPENAFKVGYDDLFNDIYLGRGLKNNSLVVVGVNPTKNEATVCFGGRAWPIHDFELLQFDNFFGWKKIGDDKKIPKGAIEGGYDENCNILHVGRIAYGGSLIPGFVNKGILSIAYKGKEIKFSSNYEVLQILTSKEVKTNEKAAIFNLQLQELDARGFVSNSEPFECVICFTECPAGEGAMLRDCLHTFCRECLSNHIMHSEEAEVKCPFQDDTYSCTMFLQDREIRALVSEEIYQKHLDKSLREAEGRMENTFHCLMPNCRGWCTFDENVVMFNCPVCEVRNCLKCKVIHEGTCEEYHEKIQRDKELKEKAANDKQTQDQMNEMLRRREVMTCPKCGAILQKISGCDHITCGVCKSALNWLRGFR